MSRVGKWTIVPIVRKHAGSWIWEVIRYPTVAGPGAGKVVRGGVDDTEEIAQRSVKKALEEALAHGDAEG
jgi:hypothetical protein